MRLITFCDDINLVPWNQFGFRNQHSTEHALVKLSDTVTKNLRNKHCTVVLDLDLEKAFDTVWSESIIFKLLERGCPTPILRIIDSFLTDRFLIVCLNNITSDLVAVGAGVSQGSVLGPPLFNISTSDFPLSSSDPSDVQCISYADDTLIIASGLRPSQALAKIQHRLPELEQYYQSWDIRVNIEKSAVVCLRNSSGKSHRLTVKESKNISLNLFGQPISRKDRIKHLGIHLHERFLFNEHARKMLNKAKRVSSVLKVLLNSKHLHKRTKLLIYKSVIRPIFSYAFIFWFTISPTVAKELEAFERRILRFITGKFRRQNLKWYPNKTLYSESNIKPLMSYLVDLMIKSINRIRTHPNDAINKIYTDNCNDSIKDHFYLSPINIAHPNSQEYFLDKNNLQTIKFYNEKSSNHRG